MTDSVKITYFGIQGPAEVPRLICKLGGLTLTDIRLDFADWTANKATYNTRYGQLPMLETEAGSIFQSGAIVNYLARRTGLVSSDNFQQTKVEEISQFINEDIRTRKIASTMSLSGDEQVKARAELMKTVLPEKFAILESLVQDNGFLVGDKITVADLYCYTMCNWIGMGVLSGLDKSVFDAFPKISGLCKNVQANEIIKKHDAEHNPKNPVW